MGNARMIAIALMRDGYDISTRNAVIAALEEDYRMPEEEAVSLADAVLMEGKKL